MSTPSAPEPTSEHAASYSEGGFWQKVRDYAEKIGATGLYYALLLYYMAQDPKVPATDKAIIVAALGYLIFPVDFIPDLLPFVGYSDDISVMVMALKKLRSSIRDEHHAQAAQKLREWFPNASPADVSFL